MSEKETDILVNKIIDMIKEKPIYFFDILNRFRGANYRDILLALGKIQASKMLGRDGAGRYVIVKK